jgi:hypothetical protein
MPRLLVATLILALVTIGSIAPRTSAAALAPMWAAAADDSETGPCCDGCEVKAGAICDLLCTTSLLAPTPGGGLPMRVAGPGGRPESSPSLVGVVWPPDAGPPKLLDRD